MALMETMIVQVANDPTTINSMNNELGSFGWSVLSIQVTHSQDSRTYTRGLDYLTGDLTTETTTINYATITYQRDRKMDNYAKLVELERSYNELREELEKKVTEVAYDDAANQMDVLNVSRIDGILHPFATRKKVGKAYSYMFKKLIGAEARSEEAIKKSDDLTKGYAKRLQKIRDTAEELL